MEMKRLFFAFEVTAPWPSYYPKGRLLDPAFRHLTLAFLGNIDYEPLQTILPEFPPSPFKIGPTGIFNECLFLPERHPRVVAWHVHWDEEEARLNNYQKLIADWLRTHDYPIEDRPFLSHVTIARSPMNARRWQKLFTPLPMMVTGLHLYESMGSLTYKPIWSLPLIAPFIELDHTADIAFIIKGESMQQLHKHAQTALAFKHPALLKYMEGIPLQNTLDDIIISLNRLIGIADSEIGCPMKAVSFHSKLTKGEILEWEMIIDV